MHFNPLVLALAGVASAQVQTLISDLASINSMTQALTTAIQGATNAQKAVPVLSKVTQLVNAINGAASVASGLGTVSEADQVSVLNAAENLYPNIIASLTATVNNNFLEDPSTGFQGTTNMQLMKIQTATDNLSSILKAKATGVYATAASSYADEIDAAFSSALNDQVPTSAQVPAIPAAGSGSSSSATAVVSSTSAASTGKASASASASAPVYSVSSAPVYTSSVATPSVVSPSAPLTTATYSVPAPVYTTTSPVAPEYTGAATQVKGVFGGAALLAMAAAMI